VRDVAVVPRGSKPFRPSTKVSAPRPEIDLSWLLADFHDELRWPLTGMSHPALEPRFPIAQQLAMPGIGWQDLCARGVQHRTSATQKELLAYLRGWCAALAGLGLALARLERLARRVPLASPLGTGGGSAAELAELDKLSLADWLDRNIKRSSARDMIELAAQMIFAVEPRELSFLYFLLYVNSGAGLRRLAVSVRSNAPGCSR
jgi:hypothetical protein